MTYLSDDDRRSERESAEERAPIALPQNFAEAVLPGLRRCLRCGRSVARHTPSELDSCGRAYDAEIQRRRAGPVQVGDVVRRQE